MMHILIADDHALILDGFLQYVRDHVPDSSASGAESREALYMSLREQHTDVLFLDIRLGADDAREFVRELMQAYPALRIIIISSFSDQATVEMLLSQGVHGYLLKSDPNTEIGVALQTVQQDEIYISPRVRAQLFTPLAAGRSHDIKLTPREAEVLAGILKARTSREIAEELFLSEKTVENHRAALFVKFDARNISDLVKKAILKGYL